MGTENNQEDNGFRPDQNTYGNPQINQNAYGGPQTNQNAYGNPQTNQNAYGNPQTNQNAYGNPQTNQNAYGNPQTNQNAYGNPQMNQNAYGNPQTNQNAYGNPQMNQNPYGSPQMNQMPYGGMQMPDPQSGNRKKNNSGLIVILCVCIGLVVIGIIAGFIYAAKKSKDDREQDTDRVTEQTVNTEDTEVSEDTEAVEKTDAADSSETSDTTQQDASSENTTEDTENTEDTASGNEEKEEYLKVLDEYFACYSNQDMQGMISYYPAEIGTKIWDDSLTMMGVDTEEDYWKLLEMYYGEDFTVTYEVTSDEMMETTTLEISFNVTYGTDMEFEKARKLTIDETCSGGLHTETVTESLCMASIDGTWYIIGALQ